MRKKSHKPHSFMAAHGSTKGHGTQKARDTHHMRGKSKLTHTLGGKKEKQFDRNAPQLFGRRAKASEPDTVGRKVRPAAHNARQAGVAKRAKAHVKRLGDRLI